VASAALQHTLTAVGLKAAVLPIKHGTLLHCLQEAAKMPAAAFMRSKKLTSNASEH